MCLQTRLGLWFSIVGYVLLWLYRCFVNVLFSEWCVDWHKHFRVIIRSLAVPKAGHRLTNCKPAPTWPWPKCVDIPLIPIPWMSTIQHWLLDTDPIPNTRWIKKCSHHHVGLWYYGQQVALVSSSGDQRCFQNHQCPILYSLILLHFSMFIIFLFYIKH